MFWINMPPEYRTLGHGPMTMPLTVCCKTMQQFAPTGTGAAYLRTPRGIASEGCRSGVHTQGRHTTGQEAESRRSLCEVQEAEFQGGRPSPRGGQRVVAHVHTGKLCTCRYPAASECVEAQTISTKAALQRPRAASSTCETRSSTVSWYVSVRNGAVKPQVQAG
jgi:hypothetical protein